MKEENVLQFRRISESPYIEAERKSEIYLKLIHYYFERDSLMDLEDYLKGLEPEGMKRKERNEAIRFMVICGLYEKAFDWVKEFGMQSADAKTLMRMCSRLISRNGFIEDRDMTHMVYYAFHKGKYDGNLLSYLVCFYKGMLWQLKKSGNRHPLLRWILTRSARECSYRCCFQALLSGKGRKFSAPMYPAGQSRKWKRLFWHNAPMIIL